MSILLADYVEVPNERCVVENRHPGGKGPGFGKIYVYRDEKLESMETIFLWGPRGQITHAGPTDYTRDQANRAIRALASTPFGARALGLELPRPILADVPTAPPRSPWPAPEIPELPR